MEISRQLKRHLFAIAAPGTGGNDCTQRPDPRRACFVAPRSVPKTYAQCLLNRLAGTRSGAVAGLVGIECGVVSGVINLESSGVEASDWRPRHDEPYHEA